MAINEIKIITYNKGNAIRMKTKLGVFFTYLNVENEWK